MGDRPTVLVIDDDSGIRTLLHYNLRLDGFTVHIAENGEDGLELARSKHPDLLLLDIRMPGMDGLEVLSEIKNNRKTRNILVFMLTAKGLVSDIEKALEIGADDYIVKPFEANNIGQTLKRKLEKFKDRK
jgi:DNA-binding response OmpR family regulator